MEYKELDDLKFIKKCYGENMSHLCRELFPSILECPGLLYHLITTHFYPNKELYNDIIKSDAKDRFKNYIYSFFENKTEEEESTASVKELLSSVGYELYECKTHNDVLKFRKYYKDSEALCTFRDPDRIKNHHIFFIVKKNVDEIKRENYNQPNREDDYSTSVLDLQFDKGIHQRVSIKSRYNHTVMNPDATYSNNLDNIVPGLTKAFEQEYGFNIGGEYKTDFELSHYVEARDGKYYKYNYERNNVHYCPDNIVLDNGIVVDDYKDKSRFLIFDYFVLDMQYKIIYSHNFSFFDGLMPLFKNAKKIEIIKKDKNRELRLLDRNDTLSIITLDSNNRIISFENNSIEEIGTEFLSTNKYLNEIKLPKLKTCGSFFLSANDGLKRLNLHRLERCGDAFLSASNVKSVNLPNLKECGNDFMRMNVNISSLSLPSLKKCGNDFLGQNDVLKEVYLPALEECGDYFMYGNSTIENLVLLSLRTCGHRFMSLNLELKTLTLPKLRSCGEEFLYFNKSLVKVKLPKLKECDNYFLYYNYDLAEIDLPNLERCGRLFLACNNILEKINLPKLRNCDSGFLMGNNKLTDLKFPSLTMCGIGFLDNNQVLESIDLPKVWTCGDNFLSHNSSLVNINMPKLIYHGENFLSERIDLVEIIDDKISKGRIINYGI